MALVRLRVSVLERFAHGEAGPICVSLLIASRVTELALCASQRQRLFQSPEDLIVVLMRSYPDPVNIVPEAPGNSSIGAAYGNRPDLSLGLKLK